MLKECLIMLSQYCNNECPVLFIYNNLFRLGNRVKLNLDFTKKYIENCTYFLIELFFNLTFDYNASKTEALSICQNSKQNIII